MNDADVSKQIQQMVRFIRQEAEEKANEISVSAEEEFNIEKLQLVEAEKKKIRQEYERKEKQVQVRKKISGVLCWHLEMGRLYLRTLLMLDWMLYSVKSCQRYPQLNLILVTFTVFLYLVGNLLLVEALQNSKIRKSLFGQVSA
ncbi:UNVERIFIED_CONTAM: V-type proton ATPase subunit E [Sesamum latifolium]|uniref:V-type proton ATPase subunit E n=1 Tax=Sesamum latifolium TaxID=2727402 RepID=A0AAW2Y2Q2_9LAMI